MTPFQLHVRAWKDCQRCELGCQRDRIVLSRGVVPCDALLIGEAPGDSEDVHGVPFVEGAPAGGLLEHLLRRAGWREMVAAPQFEGDPRIVPVVRIAFTNLVACFPKEAKASKINEPPEKAIKACRNRLAEFIIKVAQPQLVVCVGKLASKWVQTFRAGLGLGDVKLIHIVHPAGILRANEAQQGLMKQRVVVQLANALQELVPF